jgi:release factor glutamine methyltransferase
VEWTIRSVLAWTAKDFAERGIESSRLDAELLIAHALGLDRVRLYMDLDRPLDDAERAKIRELVGRRRKREPIAYITGTKEFYGRPFAVTPAVLIPRPDTETLVERALELATDTALDLCTGSGAIGLTLAAEKPELTVDLSDVSAAALAIARANAASLGVIERVRFFEGDLFAPIADRYPLITCNPPYVPESDRASVSPEVRDHEPALAVFAGDGFDIHRRLMRDTPRFLREGGVLLIEVGAGQASELERQLAACAWVASTARHRDLGGIDRVVEARAR